MSRILDYVLEPNVVYTNGAFLIKVKVQDDYKYKKYLVSESMKYTTATGTTFTLTNAVSTNNASILQLQGNTTQNGTPTPTSPVEVKTVSGDNEVEVTGENLFNKEYYKSAMYNTQNFYAYTPLKVKGGRYLLIKVALKSGGTAVSGAYLNISSGYGTPTSISSGQTITGISNGTALTRSFSFTENKLYLNIAGNIQDILNNYDIMLATSNIPYEPYIGNSYRVDFGGGNQLPQDKYIESRTTNGITYTNNGDGTFSLSGTASANTSIQIIPYNDINIQNGKSYYLLSNVPYNSNTFNMSVRFKEDTSQKYLIANGTVTVSSTATISNVDLAFWIASGNTVNAQNVKLMLVEGNTAPSRYSPYVSNPIELCKIGNYVDSIKKSTGKNLFNKDDVENDKRLDSAGQPTGASASGFSLTNYIKVEPNTKYTLSRNTTSSTYYVNISEYTSDKTHIQRLYCAGNTTTTYTFTTPNNCEYLRINDATTNLYSIQLELRRNCNKSRTLWSR